MYLGAFLQNLVFEEWSGLSNDTNLSICVPVNMQTEIQNYRRHRPARVPMTSRRWEDKNGRAQQKDIWAASWQNQHAPSEHSDQPGHSPSLIRAFAVNMKKAWVFSYPLSTQRRLWSDCANAQADLSLRCTHIHFVGFVMRRLICLKLICINVSFFGLSIWT